MKKIILIIAFLILGASLAIAQQSKGATELKRSEEPEEVFDGRIGAGWYGVTHEGNTTAGEYDYLKSSASGALDVEWDPLPHRFVLESYYLNPKDYFGEVDYSFKDIILLNGYTRSLFHNLNHYSFGPDDLTTATPSFTDLNPDDQYGIENQWSRGFIRLKTPDFPLHLFADVRRINRDGTIQQRFLSSGGLNKVSQSRIVDWNTIDYRVGINSHLGPIEAEYNHSEKKFEARGEKVLFDTSSGVAIPHNLIPDLKSSADTIKVHTTYSGKIVLAGTYTKGDKKNEDSGAELRYMDGAGDVMLMPVTSLIFTLKYRHYDLDFNNPDSVNNVTFSGIQSVSVRDSISSKRDVISSILRYRLTDRITLRGEYITENTDRAVGWFHNLTPPPANNSGLWTVSESTTKNTGKLAVSYRIMRKMDFRADYSITKVDNPAYDIDPDRAQTARASFTWMPTPRFSTMLSYGAVREKRDQLVAPLGGGSREAARDQALAVVTFMVGDRSSISASYAYYKNKVDQTVTLQDGTGAFELEPSVPYDDISHVGSVALTTAPREGVNLTGSVTRSYSRGNFRLGGAGVVTSSAVSGIADLSDMNVVDTVYGAGIDLDFTRFLSIEIQLQYRHYDDQINDAQDGRLKLAIASAFLKW